MIRIWNTNKPSYIDNKEFELWLDKMLKICDDEIVLPISISEFIDYINNSNITLNIKFSPEIIKKMNGIYSLDEVKKYIKNNFLINEKILNILDDCHTENNLKHSLNDLSGILAQLNKCSKEKIKSLLNKYIQNMLFQTVILSTYNYDDLTMTFYPNAIKQYCGSTYDVLEIYEIEFLDRIFNLFHYYHVETKKSRYSDIFKRNDYTSKVVKYSLSGYYIYTYCEHYRLEHCLKNIVNYSPLSYPKAGLLYIADFDHYYNIFTASINDFDKALRILFEDAICSCPVDLSFDDVENPMDVFYDIKNYYSGIKRKKSIIDLKTSKVKIDYINLFKKSLSLAPSTIEDYCDRIKRLFKKYYEIEEDLLLIDIKVLIKLTQTLIEKETGNNLSALNKFIDFLNEYEVNKEVLLKKVDKDIIEEIKTYIRENINKQFDNVYEEKKQKHYYSFENTSLTNLVINPVNNDIIFDAKPLKFDDDESFQEYVLNVMSEKGLSNSDIYGGSNEKEIFRKQIFYKILNEPDFIPSKDTIIIICLRLQLDLNDSIKLLNKAGYTLSTVIERDLIIRMLLQQGNYDINYYNDILETFGFKTLKGTTSK